MTTTERLAATTCSERLHVSTERVPARDRAEARPAQGNHAPQDWPVFFTRLHACLQAVQVTTPGSGRLGPREGFLCWEEHCAGLRDRDGMIFFVGNGASSSMCSHFALDVGKNARFRTHLFSDAALLTALGNDISFEQIFVEPLRRTARARDMLVAVSSSGNSPNIVAAAAAGREAGLWIVTLTGLSPANRLRSLGDVNFWVDADTYGMVETAHAAILHHWTDRLVARYGGRS